MQYQQVDAIVDIPPNRVRYFGTTGKMLLPSPATIAALIQRIPAHKLITTDLLRQRLTDQFEVEGTCPITTQKSLQVVAYDVVTQVPYWRVIRQNGNLMAKFPGGVESHAALLRQEGFTIDTAGKIPSVKQFKESLIHFG
jgi:hypothetical protein